MKHCHTKCKLYISREEIFSHSRHLKACAELISDIWCIRVKNSKVTLQATTQQGTIFDILPLSLRYQADRLYISKRLNARFAIDTLFSYIKSLHQNVCTQLFSHKVGFSATYPMGAGSGDMIGLSYKYFCHDYGVT